MASNFIKNLIANRLGGKKFGDKTCEYKFTKIKNAHDEALMKNPNMDFIDMGVGEPDAMADEGVVRALTYEVKKWNNRMYADNGIQEFKDAGVTYLNNEFNVQNIDSKDEINHCIGSKSALAMIAQIFINPGDIMLMPVPGYFVTATYTEWLGGKVYKLPLCKENNYLPELDKIPNGILKKAKLLYLNYPNNPTGAVATKEFFTKVVAFAKKNNIAVVHDAAYGALVYDGEKPLSFLSIDGAKDIGVEIHSLSKTFNMTGWRIGFIAGNEDIIRAFRIVKDNNDSGQFKPIQYAGVYAMEHSEITQNTIEKYSRRLNLLVSTLSELGFKVEKPRGTFYLYVKIPKSIPHERVFKTATDFAEYLIREKGIVTVPWDDAGHYVRFSVTFLAYGEKEEKYIMGEIYSRLKDVKFSF
ncbi:MAG TPA: LL-diaminopimelate aminotransferase [Clostridiales bacterium]|nr:MAG: aspartate aminotransferase [Clostridiales bacterium GWD2_32_19]HCC08257.1 LL-diaminopimelate aminotransferase [Clostridiales bacterium]